VGKTTACDEEPVGASHPVYCCPTLLLHMNMYPLFPPLARSGPKDFLHSQQKRKQGNRTSLFILPCIHHLVSLSSRVLQPLGCPFFVSPCSLSLSLTPSCACFTPQLDRGTRTQPTRAHAFHHQPQNSSLAFWSHATHPH